jgi:hypothetical protein
VLKKTGIIVSVAAAAVLGVGGFAFAGTPHHDPATVSNTQSGNVGNRCDFGQDGPEVSSTATQGDSGLAGAVNPVTDAIAPITSQAQLLNCTNVYIPSVDNTNSNNKSDNRESTTVEGSGNTRG